MHILSVHRAQILMYSYSYYLFKFSISCRNLCPFVQLRIETECFKCPF